MYRFVKHYVSIIRRRERVSDKRKRNKFKKLEHHLREVLLTEKFALDLDHRAMGRGLIGENSIVLSDETRKRLSVFVSFGFFLFSACFNT